MKAPVVVLNRNAKRNNVVYVLSCAFLILFYLLIRLRLGKGHVPETKHAPETNQETIKANDDAIETNTFNAEYDVTIVTAYFVIPGHKTKHSNEWYLTEGRNYATKKAYENNKLIRIYLIGGRMLLSIRNPIIVFTNVGDDVAKVREKNNLPASIPFKIINMSIDELEGGLRAFFFHIYCTLTKSHYVIIPCSC